MYVFFTGSFLLFLGSTLFSSSWNFETIALTHLIILGWVKMVMIGAFYQMVPVLVGGQVALIELSRIVHAFMIIGIVTIAGKLIQISPLFSQITIGSLLVSFTVFLTQLLTALSRVKANLPVVVTIRISLISLALTVSLDVLEVGTFAGLWPSVIDHTIFKSLHASLSLTGSVGGLLVVVGFHVIPMCYLTSPFPQQLVESILRSGMFILTVMSLALLFSTNSVILLLAMFPGVASIIIYGVTVRQMLQQRKHKIVDATLCFWQTVLLSFPLSLLCLAACLFWPDEDFLFGFGMLFLMGFAVAITNGMLYKIVPFLIWFHLFSTLVDKAKVPLLKDVLQEKLTKIQLQLSELTLLVLLPGVLLQSNLLVRIGGLCRMAASEWLDLNLLYANWQNQRSMNIENLLIFTCS